MKAESGRPGARVQPAFGDRQRFGFASKEKIGLTGRVIEPSPALERAMKRAMAENMLEEGYRVFVLQYLVREDDTWRRCCESACEPCVLKLGLVVDRTRELLGDDT